MLFHVVLCLIYYSVFYGVVLCHYVMYLVILYYVVLCCLVLCSVVLSCDVLFCIIIVLLCFVLWYGYYGWVYYFCIMLCCDVFYCFVLYGLVLCCYGIVVLSIMLCVLVTAWGDYLGNRCSISQIISRVNRTQYIYHTRYHLPWSQDINYYNHKITLD